MKIEVDTKHDSKEDIINVIRILQSVVGKKPMSNVELDKVSDDKPDFVNIFKDHANAQKDSDFTKEDNKEEFVNVSEIKDKATEKKSGNFLSNFFNSDEKEEKKDDEEFFKEFDDEPKVKFY